MPSDYPFRMKLAELGGPADVPRLPALVRGELEDYLAIAEQETAYVSSFGDPIRTELLGSPKLAGVAGVLSGEPLIGIPVGAPLVIREVFLAAATDDRILAAEHEPVDHDATVAVPEGFGTRSQLMTRGDVPFRPDEQLRVDWARQQAYVAFLFLFYHEAAHLLRDHAAVLGSEAPAFFSANGLEQSALCERDADWIATGLLYGDAFRTDLTGANAIERRLTAQTYMFAPSVVLALLDAYRPSSETAHAQPTHRVQALVLRGAHELATNYDFSEEDISRAMSGACWLLAELGRYLRFRAEQWVTPTPATWSERRFLDELHSYLSWTASSFEEAEALNIEPLSLLEHWPGYDPWDWQNEHD